MCINFTLINYKLPSIVYVCVLLTEDFREYPKTFTQTTMYMYVCKVFKFDSWLAVYGCVCVYIYVFI